MQQRHYPAKGFILGARVRGPYTGGLKRLSEPGSELPVRDQAFSCFGGLPFLPEPAQRSQLRSFDVCATGGSDDLEE